MSSDFFFQLAALVTVVIGWIVTASILWTKMGSKVGSIDDAVGRIEKSAEETAKAFKEFQQNFNSITIEVEVRLALLEKEAGLENPYRRPLPK